MQDDDTLFGCALSDNNLITLGVTGFLEFYFRGNPTSIGFVPHEDLSKVVMRASQLLGETSESCLFEIVKSSGTVEKSSSDWLPDRFSSFSRIDVQGTMLENGLLDGDEMRAYKKNSRIVNRMRN
jgi:hypothetical protein